MGQWLHPENHSTIRRSPTTTWLSRTTSPPVMQLLLLLLPLPPLSMRMPMHSAATQDLLHLLPFRTHSPLGPPSSIAFLTIMALLFITAYLVFTPLLTEFGVTSATVSRLY
uniref:Uncharacterized protein n=1 Tax=Manihot esculenta TaxID=3983 RepID=A0A251KRM3_MANES